MSDMFEKETVAKCRQCGDHITVVEIEGSHDIAGDNPEGLVKAIRTFLGKPNGPTKDD